jgi:hypothetical protein
MFETDLLEHLAGEVRAAVTLDKEGTVDAERTQDAYAFFFFEDLLGELHRQAAYCLTR